jgi:hypothetical protein
MSYDSGNEYRNGNYYDLENVRFPSSVKVKYCSWNQLMTTQYNVIFEFIITSPEAGILLSSINYILCLTLFSG